MPIPATYTNVQETHRSSEGWGVGLPGQRPPKTSSIERELEEYYGKFYQRGFGRSISVGPRSNIPSFSQLEDARLGHIPNIVWNAEYERVILPVKNRINEFITDQPSFRVDFLYDTPMSETVARFFAPPTRVFNTELHESLEDLSKATLEAISEGFPLPSETAVANAGRLLVAMHQISTRRFEVYPTPDAEVAIDAPGGYGRSVLLLCGSDGETLCLVNLGSEQRQRTYETVDGLPDDFLQKALFALDREILQ